MSRIRTYVFMFVPIPLEWVSQAAVVPGFSAGRNGSSPTDRKHNETSRWREREYQERETYALPSHLFWTWFVDNPRRSSPHDS